MERRSFSLRVDSAEELLGDGRHGCLYPSHRRIRCRTRAYRRHQHLPHVQPNSIWSAPPKHLSSDHDPLSRFHRWRANLRVLDIEELKTAPFVPRSHPFIERLIGTLRREYPDQTVLLERRRPSSQAGSFRHLLQPPTCPRRTQWSDALRAIRHDCRSTGKPRPLRMAIGRFRPLPYANCQVVSIRHGHHAIATEVATSTARSSFCGPQSASSGCRVDSPRLDAAFPIQR